MLEQYQESINQFVFLREDLRGSFTLAFEFDKLGDTLKNLLNESMLRYYLSKAFGVDKKKFRFLRTEQLLESQQKGASTKILKIIVEVVA